MNPLKDELLQIIESVGGKATLDEIRKVYAQRYKMPMSLTPRFAIQELLSDCPKAVYVKSDGSTKIVYIHLGE